MRDQKQRFCPNCGSNNVEFDMSHTNQLGEAIANPNKWKCNECNYRGPMPAGDPEKQKEMDIEFEPAEQEEIDTDFGKAELKVLLYITIPVTILAAVYFLLIQ
ncbi:hypothetical protein [Candidatus Nanohalovita haloferacivicina]|uniref:hypothetical protein n=1 Tax=Candidatus Nanohalovita haloferacivicina TaxID=2978046 RepID=UPI00325FDC24